MSTSAKRVTQKKVAEAQSVTRKVAPAATAAIETNPFYGVLFDASLSAKQKVDEFAKLMTFEGDKERARERVAELTRFSEYLQSVREEMAKEIIALTDTDTFAELKNTYSSMNQGLIDFEDRMRPLTDIIDAVYQLRTSGMTLDAFRDILEDKKAEEARRADLERVEKDIQIEKNAVAAIDGAITEHSRKRGLFGFGGLTDEAKAAIASENAARELRLKNIEALEASAATLRSAAPPPADEDPAFTEQKAKLRELLDISSEEHRERQKELVAAAMNFVETSKERAGSIKEQLEGMNAQIESLYDGNETMTSVYAIMKDGGKAAMEANRKLRAQLDEAAENEDAVTQMERESKRLAVDQHVKEVDAAANDIVTTYADLTGQAVRIKGMRDNNTDNMTVARTLHGQGVAGVADRLSTVLQAVSMAALGESSNMARDTLVRMRESTNSVTQKEAIRRAMGMNDEVDALTKVLEDLASYKDVQTQSTEITREALSQFREKLGEIESLARETTAATREAYAVNSKDETSPAVTQRVTKKASPFGNIGAR